jgi:hypothetical protein
MVTIYTTRFKIKKKTTICPQVVFVCLVWMSDQTAFISLFCINGLVFTIETKRVFCAVRDEYLNVVQVNASIYRVKMLAKYNLTKYISSHLVCCCKLLYWTCLFRILAGAPIILTEISCDFPRSLPMNNGIIPQLCHDRSLPYPFTLMLRI